MIDQSNKVTISPLKIISKLTKKICQNHNRREIRESLYTFPSIWRILFLRVWVYHLIILVWVKKIPDNSASCTFRKQTSFFNLEFFVGLAEN